jgi:uncharacterized protein YndB with AHSA1/START domain
MNEATRSHALRVSERVRATPERLFRAWTEPDQLRHWWFLQGEGWAFAGASVDLRVGGRYRLAMTNPAGQTHAACGIYREIDPPTRLVFTWDWENPADQVGETIVTVEFKDVGIGTTEIVVTHRRFADAAKMSGHERAWRELLAVLEHRMHTPSQEP